MLAASMQGQMSKQYVWATPGNFREISGKCPERVRDFSGKIPGKFPGNVWEQWKIHGKAARGYTAGFPVAARVGILVVHFVV